MAEDGPETASTVLAVPVGKGAHTTHHTAHNRRHATRHMVSTAAAVSTFLAAGGKFPKRYPGCVNGRTLKPISGLGLGGGLGGGERWSVGDTKSNGESRSDSVGEVSSQL